MEEEHVSSFTRYCRSELTPIETEVFKCGWGVRCHTAVMKWGQRVRC